VGNGETLEDGNGVRDTITRVTDETSGSAGGVEGHDGLEGDVNILDLEGLEHDSNHLLSVGLGIQRGFSENNTVRLLRGAAELVVESVVPDFLHVFPGFNDTSADGVLEVQDTFLLHGLITDVLSLHGGSLHGVGVLRATYDGGKNGAGCILTGETSLDHAGSVINNNSLLFTHCAKFVLGFGY